MKLLLNYLKPHWRLVAVAMILAAINQVFSLMDPYVFGKIIDRFAKHPETYAQKEFVNGVLLLIGAALGVAMISRIAKNFQDYTVNVVIQKFGAKVYTDGLKHALKLPFQQFEDQRSGETLAVLQKVRIDSEKFITYFINVLFTTLVGMVVVIVFAFQVYWPLIPVYFLAAAFLGFVISLLSKKVKFIQKSIVAETTALAGSTTESLRNIELVKSLGLTHQEIKRLQSLTMRILKLELWKVRNIRSINFVQGTTVNLLRQVILFMLMFLLFRERVTLGQLMTLQFYSFFIFGPLQELGNIILSYRETQVSLAQFQKILNTPIESKPEHPKTLNSITNLSFKNVDFKHASASKPALENINFEVQKGETIAFVGPSGSGKTTLVKLLVGLYLPKSGYISYNGNKHDEIDVEELRHQLGFVTQDTQLFSGSIKENLLFVNPLATNEELNDVMQKSACESLMSRADKGLDTVIGEGGIKISGGEKQRLSIARALLRKPNLLVFDEATSALDSITEEEITQTIQSISLQKMQITILIAHRLSTIMHADRIYVLEQGNIIEQGKHAELLTEKGLYYAMWRQQIGERKKEI
jgi:ATP-binding cassette subfamily B protein